MNMFWGWVKSSIEKYVSHATTILKHKWYVAKECFSRGYFLRGIMHDISKFYPSEFTPYANWFADKELAKMRNDVGTFAMDYRDVQHQHIVDFITKRKECFQEAWLHHQRRNPHHWQYWLLHNDDGTQTTLYMPEEYAVEMFCDWIAAGIVYSGKKDVIKWYGRNKDKIILNEYTRKFVEKEIGYESTRRN